MLNASGVTEVWQNLASLIDLCDTTSKLLSREKNSGGIQQSFPKSVTIVVDVGKLLRVRNKKKIFIEIISLSYILYFKYIILRIVDTASKTHLKDIKYFFRFI